jgi:hypothetical protein
MTDTQHDSESGRTRSEWQRRQAIQPAPPRYIEPTLPDRIARLNPSERHELGRLIRSMKLRKIIRRTLAEAFWNREAETIASAQSSEHATMQRLRAAVRSHESLQSYERALTPSTDAVDLSTQLMTRGPGLIEID